MSKKLAEHNPGRKIFSSKFATTIVWLITIIWTVPTVGLLVTSFKTDEKILNELREERDKILKDLNL